MLRSCGPSGQRRRFSWLVFCWPFTSRELTETNERTQRRSARILVPTSRHSRASLPASFTIRDAGSHHHGPNRPRYSPEFRNALIISAPIKSPLAAFSLLSQKL